MRCNICEFRCDIPENGTGKCRMYINKNDVIEEIYPDSYLVSVPAPIEAMPMTHLHPNSKFMQVCTIGCNFKCSGCVSWIMTENTESIDGALERIEAENLVQRALNEDCKGIMFCFNEPAVSFHTFKRLAKMARGNGLLVGCATNGYFTAEAFQDLLRHIDFINIGLKGHSDDVYKKHGAGRFDNHIKSFTQENTLFNEYDKVAPPHP
jgi:pyruvate-formate lyase-activating enzyme